MSGRGYAWFFGGADFQLVIKWGVETWPKKSLRFHATFKMISDCQ